MKALALILAFWWGATCAAREPARQPIRAQVRECATLLVEEGQLDDSVGLPFSSHDPKEFETELTAALTKFGPERFRNGRFYVLGVEMSRAIQVTQAYDDILERHGLHALGARALVLDVPTHLVRDEAVRLTQRVMEGLRYFVPSCKRDYQCPQRAEVLSGLFATGAIEIPNVIFLYSSLPALDANLTVVTHVVTLTAMTTFSKSMINWLMRSGTRREWTGSAELFLKQMLFSMPFVANFNIFGRFSEILSFYHAHGAAGLAAALPGEAVTFVATQGLTLALQTLFYSEVMTKGYARWMDAQTGDVDAKAARALRPWLQSPLLMLDAVLLAMASSNWGEPLLSWGSAEVNVGHAALLGATVAGKMFFAKFPRALNRFLPLGRAMIGRKGEP